MNTLDKEIQFEEGEYMWFSDNSWFHYPELWKLGQLEDTKEDNFRSYNPYLDCISWWNYAIKPSDFNPYNMEETLKHIWCVRDGKIVKYNENEVHI